MLSSPGTQERSEEAKAIFERVLKCVTGEDGSIDHSRMIAIFSGIITETLLEYEEPDTVMEQTFHRISELMGVQPTDGTLPEDKMPFPYLVDQDLEIGRKLARLSAEKLPKVMDDVHEIAIALVLNEFPLMVKTKGPTAEEGFRLLIECVIEGLTFEMAAQDMCDVLVDEFISDGWTVGKAIEALAAVSGVYLKKSCAGDQVKLDAHLPEVLKSMALESMRLGLESRKNWWLIGPANDVEAGELKAYAEELIDKAEEFFEIIGLNYDLAKSVAIAKAVGRIIAASANEDVGQMQPHIAKSLAKTGLVAGTKLSLIGF